LLHHNAPSLSLHDTFECGIAVGTACIDYLEHGTIAWFQNAPLEVTRARLVIVLIIKALEAANWTT
jgi:hypothetical protein